ncbi:MAG: excalibur calcium-binding domain-containing protein, partial [Verrucomicrobiaceae bacterium]
MPIAFAHGGGLNAEGCHNNRKTGDYHCHRSGGGGSSGSSSRNTPQSFLSSPQRSPGGGAFRNCTEARAAGAAPVRRGQPGYGPHLDRDN